MLQQEKTKIPEFKSQEEARAFGRTITKDQVGSILELIKENHKHFLGLNKPGTEQARQAVHRQGMFLETALRERLGPLVEKGMGKSYGAEWRNSERFRRDQKTVRADVHNQISQVFSRGTGIKPDAVRSALERADQRGGLETFTERPRSKQSDRAARQENLKSYTAIIKSPHEAQEYRVEIFVDKNLEGKELISALQQQTKKHIQEHPSFAHMEKAQVSFEKSKDLDLGQKIDMGLKR